ncbi:hypothetical protein [Halomarina ordinaria]|uniref:Peptidoglycan DD-metalloendopeptidase family protein n=1 Tax=Halomarina ordinaria TaxID=3033939 RepID=A0ABD5U8P7_9EURY|nr:hypothetical protein [Halomarina sp. PSRA2]
MVTLDGEVLSRYRRFSLYNSPYVAHDHGCAIDLYPGDGVERATDAPSPVAGEVVDTRAVRAPSKAYAAERDFLILVDTGDYVARTLHVEPSVSPGERVAVGDSLGTLVRAGFFAPWVDNHIHLGFRPHEANHHRASGSLPIDVGVPVEPLPWDGTGRVQRVGETYAVLDAPAHPAPDEHFVGVACGDAVLDGGFPHYDGGGLLGGVPGDPVSLAGSRIGTVGENGRDVRWEAVEVRANGTPITGVSLFCAQDAAFGAKLVCPETSFEVGEAVEVSIHPTE